MNPVYRPLFFADVTECADHRATEAAETVAAAWYDPLKKAVQHIQKTPAIGRLRQDLPLPGIRALNLRKNPKCLVFYRLEIGRIEHGRIELLRVRHGMMNLPELFSEKSVA